jgi:FkbM family methyltransferase
MENTMMKVAKVHVSKRYGFKYAQVEGTGDADHASWWTFDDEQIVRDRHWHIKPGDVVLDVGAAFGSYTLPALAMGARVIAFSPADFDTELLGINLDLNPELARRCLVLRDGLHEKAGFFDPDHGRFVDEATMRGLTVSDKDNWLAVRSLDAVLAERPGIDWIDWVKLDVEGAEVGVLRGAAQMIGRCHPNVLIECHQFVDNRIESQVAEAMRAYGYPRGELHQHCAVSHAFFGRP